MLASLSQYIGTVGMLMVLQTRGALDVESVTSEKCNRVNLV